MSAGWVAWLVLLKIAGIGIAYLLLAAAVLRRFAARAAPVSTEPASTGPAPSVTVLKPLHGAEPGLLTNLATFVDQDHEGPLQIVLGVQDEHDPALVAARELRRLHPDRDIAIAVDGRLHGANRKVSNLINMMEAAHGEVIVLADSDMRVGPDYLARLLAALERPGVGAVTCLYHGLAAEGGRHLAPPQVRGRALSGEPETPSPQPSPHRGEGACRGAVAQVRKPCSRKDELRPAVGAPALWSRLSALAIDTHFLPSVVFGLSVGLATPCMGSTIALRRETLDRIGGFRALADTLADDYELGAALRRLGLVVAVPPFTIGHVCAERSFRDLWTQELRWVRTIRLIDPAGHLGSAISHPAAFALAAFVVSPGFTALAVFAAACLARIGLCLAAERAFGLRTHPYWLVPARDLLSAGVYVASFFGRGVSWRGHRYEVARTGALSSRTRPS